VAAARPGPVPGRAAATRADAARSDTGEGLPAWRGDGGRPEASRPADGAPGAAEGRYWESPAGADGAPQWREEDAGHRARSAVPRRSARHGADDDDDGDAAGTDTPRDPTGYRAAEVIRIGRRAAPEPASEGRRSAHEDDGPPVGHAGRAAPPSGRAVAAVRPGPAPVPPRDAAQRPAPPGQARSPRKGARGMGDTQAGYDDLAWWTAADDDHDPFPGR
jgi:hypothetical protein